MNNLKIILMLYTVIPCLDGCSSRALFHGKPINFFRTVELPLSTPTQIKLNYSNAVLTSFHVAASASQATVITDNHQSTLSYEIKLSSNQLDLELKNNDDARLIAGHHHNAAPSNTTDIDVHYKMMSEIASIECVEWFRLAFCLNGGRCFLYPILNQSLSSCECAEGYVGERCEVKSYEFIPRIRPRIVLAKTIGGPFIFGLATIDLLFLLFLLCKMCNRD